MIALLIIAAYFGIGIGAGIKALPWAWNRTRKTSGFMDQGWQRTEVKMWFALFALGGVFTLAGFGIVWILSRTVGKAITNADPQRKIEQERQRARELDERERKIRALELDLGIVPEPTLPHSFYCPCNKCSYDYYFNR